MVDQEIEVEGFLLSDEELVAELAPVASSVRVLRLREIEEKHLRALYRLALPELTALHLEAVELEVGGIAALLSLPGFGALKQLSISMVWGEEAVGALCAYDGPWQIEDLKIDNTVKDKHVSALLAAPWLGRLRHLALTRSTLSAFGLYTLFGLDHGVVGGALMRSSIETLDLSGAEEIEDHWEGKLIWDDCRAHLGRLCVSWPWMREPPLRAARNLEIEAAIRADPLSADGYSVYADWLRQHGDPRADLIDVQRELTRCEASRRADLEARQAELLQKWPFHLRGSTEGLEPELHLGFVRSVTVRDVEELVRYLDHPAYGLLQSLRSPQGREWTEDLSDMGIRANGWTLTRLRERLAQSGLGALPLLA